jgi:phenylalanyl-tRNA synthetase alpha chain
VSVTVSLQDLTAQLEQLEAQAAAEIASAASGAELEELRVGLLGKKGRLSAVLGAMGKLPGEERPVIGQRANVLKEQLSGLLAERLQAVKSAAMAERIARETLDVTAPCSFTPPGHRHPLISTIWATACRKGRRSRPTTTTSPPSTSRSITPPGICKTPFIWGMVACCAPTPHRCRSATWKTTHRRCG